MANLAVKKRAIRILRDARDLIESVGWVRFKAWRILNGKIVGYCAMGAIEAASKRAIRARQEAWDVLGEVIVKHSSASNITTFNDSYAKDRRMVLAMFRRAIKQLEEEVSA